MGLAHSPRIVTNGLVLYLDAGNTKSYPGTGTTWTDLSGKGNNGTLQSMSGANYSSANGGYLVFDGASDYISIAFSGSVYCIDFWIKPASTLTSSTSFSSILDFNNGQQSLIFGSCTQFFNGELITLLTNPDGVSSHYQRSAYVSTTDSISGWTHVNCNHDGTHYVFTVNGIIKQKSFLGTSDIINAISPIYLGKADGSGINGFYNGNISNLKLYNKALTAAEILQNYNALKRRYT